MVFSFNEIDVLRFKEKNPDAVILLSDPTKNPGSVMSSWDKVEPQTSGQINKLLDAYRQTPKTVSAWGIRNSTNDYWAATLSGAGFTA